MRLHRQPASVNRHWSARIDEHGLPQREQDIGALLAHQLYGDQGTLVYESWASCSGERGIVVLKIDGD